MVEAPSGCVACPFLGLARDRTLSATHPRPDLVCWAAAERPTLHSRLARWVNWLRGRGLAGDLPPWRARPYAVIPLAAQPGCLAGKTRRCSRYPMRRTLLWRLRLHAEALAAGQARRAVRPRGKGLDRAGRHAA